MNIVTAIKKETKKKLIEYINKFNKSEDFKHVKWLAPKSNDIGNIEYKDFFIKVKKLIVLYNYTGNLV
jgi:hypothetical protein